MEHLYNTLQTRLVFVRYLTKTQGLYDHLETSLFKPHRERRNLTLSSLQFPQDRSLILPDMASSFPQFKNGEYINEATTGDVPDIRKMVDKAYSKYIDRIGRPPAPMMEDYHSEIEENSVYVLKDSSGSVIGLLVLICKPESGKMEIKNLVIDPKAQGHGYGRVLMNHADSMALLYDIHTIELYTNVRMYENITLYAKLGFSEVERRIEDGFERVYFRKELSHTRILHF